MMAFSLALWFGLSASLAVAAVTLAPATITLGDLEQSYTGQDKTHPVSISISPEGEYTQTVTYNGKAALPVNAGTYTVKVTATNATHKGTVTGKLVVRKVPLEVSADDKGRLFGAANPVFTFTYTGFVNGETSTVIDKKPAGVPTAKSTSPVGTYTINVVGGSDLNYEFTRVPGTLTVVSFPGGAYETLISGLSDDIPLGKLDITLPTKGDVYTGVLHLVSEAKSVAFKGRLTNLASDYSSVSSTATITVGANVYTLGLVLNAEGLEPSLTFDSAPYAEVFDPVALVAYTKTNPAPSLGAYTLALTDPENTDFFRFDYPEGATTATVSIAVTGVLSLSGKLADGTTLTASAKPDATHTYRFFVRPHGARAQSFFGGSVRLFPHPDPARSTRYYASSAIDGPTTRIYWRKEPLSPTKLDSTYPEGFGPLDYLVDLDPWLPPAAFKKATATAPEQPAVNLMQRLGLVPDSTGLGILVFNPGALDFGTYFFDLPLKASLNAKGAVAPVFAEGYKSRAGWKMSIVPTTGRFTGSFILKDEVANTATANPDDTKIHTRTITFHGVMRQPVEGDTLLGVGHLMLPPLPDDAFATGAVSAEVEFTPKE